MIQNSILHTFFIVYPLLCSALHIDDTDTCFPVACFKSSQSSLRYASLFALIKDCKCWFDSDPSFKYIPGKTHQNVKIIQMMGSSKILRVRFCNFTSCTVQGEDPMYL